MADEIDKYDEKDVSVHFILYAEEDGRKTPAGTIRMVKDSLKVGCIRVVALQELCLILLFFRSQLGRLAVQKDYRGYGLGKVLVQAVHDWVKDEGGREVLRQRAGGAQQGNVVTVKLESQVSQETPCPRLFENTETIAPFYRYMRSSFIASWGIIKKEASSYAMAVSFDECLARKCHAFSLTLIDAPC
jgi:GNAT superfamily N-acetyltransferase